MNLVEWGKEGGNKAQPRLKLLLKLLTLINYLCAPNVCMQSKVAKRLPHLISISIVRATASNLHCKFSELYKYLN